MQPLQDGVNDLDTVDVTSRQETDSMQQSRKSNQTNNNDGDNGLSVKLNDESETNDQIEKTFEDCICNIPSEVQSKVVLFHEIFRC